MEIYFSGHIPYWAGGNDCFGMKHYLGTYADLRDRTTMTQFLAYFRDKPFIDLFLDSGAFSAMNSGIKLNLHEYISFINRYGHMFKIITALDVHKKADITLRNFLDMLDHVKYRIMPVHHMRASWEYLDQYIDLCNAYDLERIAIGGMTEISSMERTEYCIKFANRVHEKNPNIKVHAFGIGTMPNIKKIGHMIDSVDTTNWLYPVKWANVKNRPKTEKNELTRHQLEKFLRHEVLQYTKLENNINEWKQGHMNEQEVKATT